MGSRRVVSSKLAPGIYYKWEKRLYGERGRGREGARASYPESTDNMRPLAVVLIAALYVLAFTCLPFLKDLAYNFHGASRLLTQHAFLETSCEPIIITNHDYYEHFWTPSPPRPLLWLVELYTARIATTCQQPLRFRSTPSVLQHLEILLKGMQMQGCLHVGRSQERSKRPQDEHTHSSYIWCFLSPFSNRTRKSKEKTTEVLWRQTLHGGPAWTRSLSWLFLLVCFVRSYREFDPRLRLQMIHSKQMQVKNLPWSLYYRLIGLFVVWGCSSHLFVLLSHVPPRIFPIPFPLSSNPLSDSSSSTTKCHKQEEGRKKERERDTHTHREREREKRERERERERETSVALFIIWSIDLGFTTNKHNKHKANNKPSSLSSDESPSEDDESSLQKGMIYGRCGEKGPGDRLGQCKVLLECYTRMILHTHTCTHNTQTHKHTNTNTQTHTHPHIYTMHTSHNNKHNTKQKHNTWNNTKKTSTRERVPGFMTNLGKLSPYARRWIKSCVVSGSLLVTPHFAC